MLKILGILKGTYKWRILFASVLGFTLSNTQAFNPVLNGDMRAIAVQSDGKILIAGNFTTVDTIRRPGVARLNANGSVDSSFNPKEGADRPDSFSIRVSDIGLQNDDKVLIIGGFSNIDGINRNGIARLNSDGSLDQNFDPGALLDGSAPSFFSQLINSLAFQADGKILIGGYFEGIAGNASRAIVRLNIDGSVDQSFNAGDALEGNISSIVVQDDGKIVAGGFFRNQIRKSIFRLNTDGSIDQTFDRDDLVGVSAIALQTDGKMLISGGFTRVGSIFRSRVARLNLDGSVDESFDTDYELDGEVRALAVQNNEKTLIAGDFTNVAGLSRFRIARLNQNGSVDLNFDTGVNREVLVNNFGSTAVRAITIQPNDKILIGGDFSSLGGFERINLARLNKAGSVDNSQSSLCFPIKTINDEVAIVCM